MKIKKMLSFILCLSMLTGCGQKESIPQLIEPVVKNESFRPVDRGSVSEMEVQMADVVPEEYCHFLAQASKVQEICVDLWQYVEEGTVLATVDVSAFQAELAIKQRELQMTKNNYSYQEKIYKEQVNIEKYKKTDYRKEKDKKAVKDCDTAMEVLDENKHYDKLLYEHQITMLQEEIDKLQDNIEKGTIYATHSGYVTYIKNMEKDNSVSAYENIVIVSDDKKLHLELANDVSSHFYTHYIGDVYDQIYTIVDGKHRNVEVYQYTNREHVAMQSAQRYSRIRLELESLEKIASAGDKLLVYFSNTKNEAVLRIGTDSLYSEKKKHFVYVKNGTGKQKKEIQIGYQGEMYVEVTDGLEEGEWVYYTSGSIMPEQYTKYTVKVTDFAPMNSDMNLKASLTYTKMHPYTLESDAVVESVYFANGDAVKKGDLICVLNMGTGSAQMKEVKQNMSNLTQDYESNIDDMDKQMKALDKQIKSAKKKKDNGKNNNVKSEETAVEKKEQEASQNKEESKKENETTLIEQLESQKIILQYEKKKMKETYEYEYEVLQQEYLKMLEVNNGQGRLEVYAKQDGMIGNLNIYEDKDWKAEEGTVLFQIYAPESRKLFVHTRKDYVGVGNQIALENGVKGTVVGSSPLDKSYIAGKDDKVYITYSGGLDGENKVYVCVDEKDWSDKIIGSNVTYSLASLKDVVVVSNTMLFEEAKRGNPEDRQYYVWKIVDDILIKQYVQIAESFDTSNQVCVLDGLEEGDVLARPIVSEE